MMSRQWKTRDNSPLTRMYKYALVFPNTGKENKLKHEQAERQALCKHGVELLFSIFMLLTNIELILIKPSYF